MNLLVAFNAHLFIYVGFDHPLSGLMKYAIALLPLISCGGLPSHPGAEKRTFFFFAIHN